MLKQADPYYTTNDELEFLEKVGKSKGKVERLVLLKGYLKGIQHRRRWAGLNKDRIVAYVKAEIDALEKVLDENQ